MTLEGSCHCGDISLRFETTHAPAELPVTICGCSFCLKHRPRFTTDPSGSLAITYKDDSCIGRYRFALRLADFLVCRTCGVFVCTYLNQRSCINLDALTRALDFTATPARFTRYNETPDSRKARWMKEWTPATLSPR